MTVSRRFWLGGLLAAPFLWAVWITSVPAQDDPAKVIEVRIETRRVVAPEGAIKVTEGDQVEIRWTSDEDVELHLHGYDVEFHVQPNEPASMTLEAYATGRFPITSHRWGDGSHGHDALIHLEVYPR